MQSLFRLTQSIQVANFSGNGSGELIAMELQESKLRHLLYVRTNRAAERVVIHVELQKVGQIVHVGGDRAGESIEVHIKLEEVT